MSNNSFWSLTLWLYIYTNVCNTTQCSNVHVQVTVHFVLLYKAVAVDSC